MESLLLWKNQTYWRHYKQEKYLILEKMQAFASEPRQTVTKVSTGPAKAKIVKLWCYLLRHPTLRNTELPQLIDWELPVLCVYENQATYIRCLNMGVGVSLYVFMFENVGYIPFEMYIIHKSDICMFI